MKILLMLLVFLVCVSAQAATLASARAKVDAWLTNNWSAVTTRQATYLAAHGRYWQGLLTCTDTNGIPNFTTGADGDSIQNNLASKPYYQSESITDIFPEFLGLPLPAAFECTQYVGPFGKGYVVTVWVRFNGTIYTRSKGVGPESRDAAWAAWVPGL